MSAQDGKVLVQIPPYPYPAWATNSVKIPRKLTSSDFILKARFARAVSKSMSSGSSKTRRRPATCTWISLRRKVNSGLIFERDLAKIALVERHHGTGNVQVAFVSGYGFTAPCAVASTVAHDSHHLIIVGTDETCMAMAANRLAETGGGQVVVRDGKIIGEVQLPIAGSDVQ